MKVSTVMTADIVNSTCFCTVLDLFAIDCKTHIPTYKDIRVYQKSQ